MIDAELKAYLTSAGPATNDPVDLDIAPSGQLQFYPQSMNGLDDTLFFMARHEQVKALYILAADGDRFIGRAFQGEAVQTSRIGSGQTLYACPMDAANAAALRQTFAFTKPVLIGLDDSFGFGDRLGLANPAHLRALADHPMRPILAQQSIRELERTERTPQEVMDVATWAVFQEGYRAGFGADADHLKTTADIDIMVKAGFLMFTIDPGAYVVNEADTLALQDLGNHVQGLSWDILEDTVDGFMSRYEGQTFPIGDTFTLQPDREAVLRALTKYGGVITHTVKMVRYLQSTYPDHPAEIELSVDETESVTSPFEHYLVAVELKRLGIELVSIAPRFVGGFEKGIDYKGDLAEFEDHFIKHVAIAEQLGPYKISFHSGSDKFRVYEAVGALGLGHIHIKTAGTSYLEALRTLARTDPPLFREILEFSRAHYEDQKKTYHVSAELARVKPAASYGDDELANLFENDHARQVMHVTFGIVLTQKNEDGSYRFRERMLAALDEHEAAHYEILGIHFRRHLDPFNR